jgi:hypothetical protein
LAEASPITQGTVLYVGYTAMDEVDPGGAVCPALMTDVHVLSRCRPTFLMLFTTFVALFFGDFKP